MTGGQPVFVSPPQYAQPRPVQVQPAQVQAPQPWPPRPVQQAQTAPKAPTIRAMRGDETPEPSIQTKAAAPKLEPLSLPPPESLGLAPKSAPPKVDWNATLEHLDRLGRIGHQVVQLDDG